MSLKDLSDLAPLYSVPQDDLVGEVLIPAMSVAASVRCMVGFFSSSSLRYIAPGIAAFVNSSTGSLELLISPVVSEEDLAAMRDAVENPASVLARAAQTILEAGRLSESSLEHHALECLSYLLAKERLVLRFALMPQGGIFHPKVWLFSDPTGRIAVHGSSNVTAAGLLFNLETVSVERTGTSAEAEARIGMLEALFLRLWTGDDPNTLVIDLPAGLRIAQTRVDRAPTVEDFWRAWHRDAVRGLAPPVPRGHEVPPVEVARESLSIPAGLEWETGPFSHQAEAVRAWEDSGCRGLLAMATGSGKTITSFICATRLLGKTDRLLVVVAAPFRPLIEQWTEEARQFGVNPLQLTGLSSTQATSAILTAVRRLERGVSTVEIAVVTHDYLVSDSFIAGLESIPESVPSLLIADEVHNLGRPRFVSRPPEQFMYRLGLSATPVLQYNELGSKAIVRFFGETVFEFGLAEAIGVCLVPYDYHLHPVQLADDELDEWDRLTAKLMQAGFSTRDEGVEEGISEEVLALLVKRRAVLEGARAKIGALRREIDKQGRESIRHTLVYCSDKRPEQLIEVNRALLDMAIFVRQLTAEETSDRRKTALILSSFADGEYQIITCKRVLDEGVDIPQVRQAFLLASSTVRRQWIQRRGRILRRCDAIGKRRADLHDFVVMPPDPRSSSGRAILRQELDRARAFAVLAANAGSPNGPFAQIDAIAG